LKFNTSNIFCQQNKKGRPCSNRSEMMLLCVLLIIKDSVPKNPFDRMDVLLVEVAVFVAYE